MDDILELAIGLGSSIYSERMSSASERRVTSEMYEPIGHEPTLWTLASHRLSGCAIVIAFEDEANRIRRELTEGKVTKVSRKKSPPVPSPKKPGSSDDAVEQIEIPTVGEVRTPTLDAPPRPPSNKTIHRRRPLPKVPDDSESSED